MKEMMHRNVLILFLALMPILCFAQNYGQNYEEYVVKSKETIYSISRTTGIKVSDILDCNPGFTRLTKLKLGQIVKLPARAAELAPQNIVTTPIDPMKEVLIPASFVPDSSGKCVVAILLPFYAKESGFNEDEGATIERKVPAKAEQFMQFYEGTLIALDSLKNSGAHVEYQVFDIGRGVELLAAEMEALNKLAPDMIIGPVYEEQAKYLCDHLGDKTTPVIYPLSSKSSGLKMYNNLVLLNISDSSLASEMALWLRNEIHSSSANVVYLDMGLSKMSNLSYQIKQKVAEIPELVTYKWNSAIDADSNATLMKPMLRTDVENYFIVPTENQAELSRALPIILLCKDEFKVTLVGLPDWQTYTLLDIENYYRLNMTLFTYSYTDGTSNAMKNFAAKFMKYFGYAPSNLACKGFDTALFFGELAFKMAHGKYKELNGVAETGVFSTFKFMPVDGGVALENRALYGVTYGRDYILHINQVN